MICMCNNNSGQKRFDGVPAKSAADSVSQGGFPLEHQCCSIVDGNNSSGLNIQQRAKQRCSAGCFLSL